MPNYTPPISVAEGADETGIPRRTIQAALTTGELKGHKFSGQTGAWVIERADFEAWLATREAAS